MDLASYFAKVGQKHQYDKGDVVFKQGDFNDNLYYLSSGLLKAFYMTPDGKVFVKSFIRESNVIGNLTALMSEEPCSFSLVCLEPCSLLHIKFSYLVQLAENDIAIANALIKLLINLAIKKERREYEFLCLSAEERYQIIKQQAPDLLKRVTQNDIARYLGITPVALSRIRARTAVLKSRGEIEK